MKHQPWTTIFTHNFPQLLSFHVHRNFAIINFLFLPSHKKSLIQVHSFAINAFIKIIIKMIRKISPHIFYSVFLALQCIGFVSSKIRLFALLYEAKMDVVCMWIWFFFVCLSICGYECVFVLAVNRTILLTQVQQFDCRSFSHSLFLALLPAVQRFCGEIRFETSLWVRNYFYTMLKVMGWDGME